HAGRGSRPPPGVDQLPARALSGALRRAVRFPQETPAFNPRGGATCGSVLCVRLISCFSCVFAPLRETFRTRVNWLWPKKVETQRAKRTWRGRAATDGD